MEASEKVFVAQRYWDEAYTSAPLFVAPKDDPVRQWLESHFQKSSGSCLELGCFPGRYLSVFGELGYELHGIDLTPRVETDLPKWMTERGYRVGEFIKGDVLTYPFDRKFDVVCSFGLIEHFENWARLLHRHAELLKPNGFLAVTTPNFRGLFQQIFHRWLDKDNLSLHNLDAMEPSEWARAVKPMAFEILECGWFGPFDFWVGNGRRNRLQKVAVRLIPRTKPLWRFLPGRHPATAPYCALLARKLPS